MGHVAVPWYIGGNAVTPDKMARLVSFIGAGGRQGVLNPLDCRVRALDTPGPAVRVMPGAYVINSQQHANENYLGMMDPAETVAVAATGSSGGRSDLVCFVVKDSNDPLMPWNPPSDPVNGPYVETEIITGVPPTTKSYADLGLLGTAYAPARIDRPANTAAITQDMITDLRAQQTGGAGGLVGASPTPASATFADCMPGHDPLQTLYPVGSNTSPWVLPGSVIGPAVAFPSQCNWQVPIPAWATSLTSFFEMSTFLTSSVWGQLRLNFGDGALVTYWNEYLADLPSFAGSSQQIFYNTYGMRDQLMAGGNLTIPPALRGQTVPLKVEARPIDSQYRAYRGSALFGNSCLAFLNLVFKQDAVAA